METEKDFSCAVPSVILGWLWETQKNESPLCFAEDRSQEYRGSPFPKKKNTQEEKKVKEKERTELGEKKEERDGGRKRVEDLKWWRNEEGKSLQKRKEKTEGGRPKKK